mgnify:CR=1 FL=1
MHRLIIKISVLLFFIIPSAFADISIPFDQQLDFMIVKLGVNKKDSLNFIFDTGAYQTIIDSKTAKILGLQKTDILYDKKSDQIVDRSQWNKIYFDNAILLPSIDLYMIDLNKLSEIIGLRIDGVIGYDLLKQFPVHIHMSSQQLVLYNDKYNPAPEAKKIKLIVERGKPMIEAGLHFYNNKQMSGKFLIDSGSAFPVSVYGGGENKPSQEDLPEIYEFYSVGLFGNVKEKLGGNIEQLKFGELAFNKVPICMEKEEWNENKAYGGILGAELIKKFNLILDFDNHISYWEPNDNFHEPFRINKLGIVLRRDTDKDKIYVKHVFEESIAKKFDIQENDIVLRINGVELKLLPMTKIYRMMEGKIEQMVLERGDHRKYIHFRPVSR